MFKRPGKKQTAGSEVNNANSSAVESPPPTSSASIKCHVVPVTSSNVSVVDEVDAADVDDTPAAGQSPVDDEPIAGRMKRNLFVSRSGRYKSKSRPRPALNHPAVADVVEPPPPGPRSSAPVVVTSQIGQVENDYGRHHAVVSTTGNGYRGLTTAL